MGGGILPIAFKNGKIYFLFGREALDVLKESGLWSDFGGGKEKNDPTSFGNDIFISNLKGKPLFLFSRDNRFRIFVHKIVVHSVFDNVILGLIFV